MKTHTPYYSLWLTPKKLLPALCFLGLMFFGTKTYAGPIRGANISFQSNTTDTLFATLSVYTDCASGAPSTPSLVLVDCHGTKTSYTASSSTNRDITNVPSWHCDYCSATSCGFAYGIRQYNYPFTIPISGSCCDYTLQYVAVSGRSSALTTGGAGTDMMVQTHIHMCSVGIAPNSGYLTVPPRFIECANTCNQRNLSSGSFSLLDSFVYRLVPPLDGSGNPITYKSGYNYKQPLKNSGTSCHFQLDSTTGDLTFNTVQDNAAMAVSIEHWYRTKPSNTFVKTDDMTVEYNLEMINCPSNSPTVLTKLTGKSDTVHICPNMNYCAKIYVTDKDASDTISLKWNSNISGASFATASPSSGQYGQFCWRPSNTYISSNPYLAVISAYDNHVPQNKYDKTICIYVDSVRYKATVVDSGCGKEYLAISPLYSSVHDSIYNVSISPANATAVKGTNWYRISANGTYTVSFTTENLDEPSCTHNYYIPFSITNIPKRVLLTKDTLICSKVPVVLRAGPAKKYAWTPVKYLSNTAIDTPTANPDTNTIFYLTTTDANNCIVTDSVKVHVSTYTTGIVKGSTICKGSSATISVNKSPGALYTWSPTNGLAKPDSASTAADPISPTLYKVTVVLDGGNGCSYKDSVALNINNPIAKAASSAAICLGDSIQLGASGGQIYSWTGDNTISNPTIANPWVKPVSTNTYTVSVHDSLGCDGGTAQQTIQVNKFSYSVSGGGKICKGDTAHLKITGGNKYAWSPSTGLDDPTSATPRATPATTTDYYFTVTDSTMHCSHNDSVLVTVKTFSHSVSGGGINCYGDTITLQITGGNKFSWSPSTGLSNTSIAAPKAYPAITTTYRATITDTTVGCTYADSLKVKVDKNCVWPGDANADKKVTITDVLNIGLAYGDTGSTRPSANNGWYGQTCTDWAKSFKSGANHKHADCNGDGIVDTSDLRPIVSNFGKSHPKTAQALAGNASDAPLTLVFSKDSAATGDTVTVAISLGTSSLQASNIYGLALQINYDGYIHRPRYIHSDFSGSWLGTIGKDLMVLTLNDSVNNAIDLGISRTDHKSVTGFGQIGVLSIAMPEDIAGKREVRGKVHLVLTDYKCIDASENDISLNPVGDSIWVYEFKSSGIAGEGLTSLGLQLYPNPVNGTLHAQLSQGNIQQITITDMVGKSVYETKALQDTHQEINVSNFAKGMYIINIHTNKGILRARFIKE